MNIKRLYKAIDINDKEYLNRKFKKSVSVESSDKDGFTLFHYAIYFGNLEMAQWLLDQGADIDKLDVNQYAPIITACENGYLNMVKFLVQNKCKLKIESWYQPLHMAACFGFDEIVKYLLEIGMDINEKDRGGSNYTPLHWAAQEGRVETVKLLISLGAIVNTHNYDFATPLKTATGEGHYEIVKILLENGARVDGEPERDDTPLMSASSYGNLDIVMLLIKAGADINWKDSEGRTSLFYAKLMQRGQSDEVVNYLLDSGADSTTVDIYGYTISDLDNPKIREDIKNEE